MGFSNSEKIISLCSFKIPYFVGPLNATSPYAWHIKKEGKQNEKILPWTFNEIIDLEKTGEEFINRLTNECTYLKGEPVLPKNSLLYQEFTLLNELNKIKVNNSFLTPECKTNVINKLFKSKKKVTLKAFSKFLNAEYFHGDGFVVTGIMDEFNANLSTWIDLANIIPEEKLLQNKDLLDEAIRLITIYSQDKTILTNALHKILDGKFTFDEIKKIVKLNYQGWGKLSRKLIDEIEFENTETGEFCSVMKVLRETNLNFMQLLTTPFTLQNIISQSNTKNIDKIVPSYDSVMDDLNVSSVLRRSIWQCIKIIEEIKKITGKNPKKIFVEVARGEDKQKKRKKTLSRGIKLSKIYEDIKDGEYEELKKELEQKIDAVSASKRLYLYFTQLGKCMYSGEPIELDQLFSNMYDVDHIFPRSKIRDDSLDNLVLVKSELNKLKSNSIVDSNTQAKMKDFWNYLKSRNLISNKKLEHLTTKELTAEIIGEFLNSQLTTTRYATISVIRVLESFYDLKPVYVKAGLVTEFRKDILNYVKCRTLNDLHHAKDAYLNIVVGNVYNSLFTSNPLVWLKKEKKKDLNISTTFNRFIFRKKQSSISGKQIWDPKINIAQILNFLESKNIQCTLRPYTSSGALYDETIYSPKDTQNNPKFALKKELSLEKYGGYKSEKSAYFTLVEIEDNKGNTSIRIDSLPLILNKYQHDEVRYKTEVESYLRNKLKLKATDNLKILIPKILKNTILKIDGFPYYLTGNNEQKLLLRGEPQLLLPTEYERLLEQAVRFLKSNKPNVSYANSINKVKNFDENVFREDNWRLYQELKHKYENSIFKYRINWSSDNYIDADAFNKLTVLKQCKLLIEMVRAFNRASNGVDLQLIGKSKLTGKISLSKSTLAKKQRVSLIHKSICGLFEQEQRIK